ncbi:MAG: hypothetical protein QXP01_03135 [Candidatus Hadarchaeum sp.]
MKRLALLLLLYALGSFSLYAQSLGNLNVTAQNQNGSNVAGAEVLRYTSTWQYIDQRTTGSDYRKVN